MTSQMYRTLHGQLEELLQLDLKPTVNVARHWALVAGMYYLSQDKFDKWASATHLMKISPDAVDSKEEEPAADSEFNVDTCKISEYGPTEEDEIQSQDIDQLTDLDMTAEKALAYDQATLKFPKYYVENWACDSVFDNLSRSTIKSEKMMKAWLAYEQGVKSSSNGAVELGPKALGALSAITMFAQAYLGIVA